MHKMVSMNGLEECVPFFDIILHLQLFSKIFSILIPTVPQATSPLEKKHFIHSYKNLKISKCILCVSKRNILPWTDQAGLDAIDFFN